jgi:hypothetical protein
LQVRIVLMTCAFVSAGHVFESCFRRRRGARSTRLCRRSLIGWRRLWRRGAGGAHLRRSVVVAAFAAHLCLPAVVAAQDRARAGDPPERAPIHLGPVTLAPLLTLSDVGWDSNVFLREDDGEPEGDFTATTSPRVDAWMRVGRMRMYGRSTVAFVYFKEHPSEGSVDGDHEGRLDLVMRYFSPYVAGRWVDARQRFGFEIDQRIERHERIGRAGVELQLSPRTTLDVEARRSRFEFVGDEFADQLVTNFYDYTTHGVALDLHHELTPLTSFGVTVDRHRDTFDNDPIRDGDSLGVAGGLDFKPSAAVNGAAYIGWQRVDVFAPGVGSFSGLTASVNLGYTLLGATRLAVEAERDVSYSAVRNQHAYLLAGVRASVQHRLGETWDVAGRAGHHRLSYGLFDLTAAVPPVGEAPGAADEHEIVTEYGGEVGCRLGPSTRWSFQLSRQHRQSGVAEERDYERIRAGISLTYRY